MYTCVIICVGCIKSILHVCTANSSKLAVMNIDYTILYLSNLGIPLCSFSGPVEGGWILFRMETDPFQMNAKQDFDQVQSKRSKTALCNQLSSTILRRGSNFDAHGVANRYNHTRRPPQSRWPGFLEHGPWGDLVNASSCWDCDASVSQFCWLIGEGAAAPYSEAALKHQHDLSPHGHNWEDGGLLTYLTVSCC
eukprot:6471625-Amphidinium_carterae.1